MIGDWTCFKPWWHNQSSLTRRLAFGSPSLGCSTRSPPDTTFFLVIRLFDIADTACTPWWTGSKKVLAMAPSVWYPILDGIVRLGKSLWVTPRVVEPGWIRSSCFEVATFHFLGVRWSSYPYNKTSGPILLWYGILVRIPRRYFPNRRGKALTDVKGVRWNHFMRLGWYYPRKQFLVIRNA